MMWNVTRNISLSWNSSTHNKDESAQGHKKSSIMLYEPEEVCCLGDITVTTGVHYLSRQKSVGLNSTITLYGGLKENVVY